MFDGDSHILVAVSGGKDSLALWLALNEMGYKADALHINLGIAGMSEESLAVVLKVADSVSDSTLHVLDLKDETGFSMEEIVSAVRRPACSTCGVVKRYLINKFAFENGYDVVATGHHLSDEASVLMANLLSWNDELLSRQYPSLPSTHEKLVRKVKPFVFVYESEIEEFIRLKGVDVASKQCPLSKGARTFIYRQVVELLESKQKGITYRFYKGFLDRWNFDFDRVHLNSCEICGYPTTGRVCSFCRIMNQVDRKFGSGEED